MKNYIREIVEKYQLDVDYDCVKQLSERNSRCYFIEGVDEAGLDVSILVYDCSKKNNYFNYDEYKEMSEKLGELFQLIMIFDDWDSEWKIMQESYKLLKKSSQKKELLNIFEKKVSYYVRQKNLIEIQVDSCGENYLEYLNQEQDAMGLRGRIYNVSLKELKKIFNVTGKELFKENVRFGLRKNKVGTSLRTKFKEYIKIGAYLKWINQNETSFEEKQLLKQLFEIDDDYNNKKPDDFWFYHNGITIYSNVTLDFSGNKIKINPRNISVINGAQTLTNFFECTKMLSDEFFSVCENIIDDDELKQKLKEHMKDYILEAKDIIKVKTILIEGNKECLQPITCGLNTQIPIKESDILAISSIVSKINKHLLKKNMKIVKEGEILNIEKAFSVMEFVKYYLVIENKPGQSKNLNRKDIEKYLSEALDKLNDSNNVNLLLNSLSKVNQVEIWWMKTKKMREEIYCNDNEKLYGKYGKNYFSSFMVNQDLSFLDDESLIQFYDIFIKDFMELNSSPDLSEFKKDKLFDQYLKRATENQTNAELLPIDYVDLKDYLNSNKKSYYTIQKNIREYLKMQNIDVSNFIFRVIARTDNKVREAFPFPNSTFTEIYQNQMNNEKPVYNQFQDSEFFKNINRTFPVFIIDWEEIGNERMIKNIDLIKEFSFKSLNLEAKNVYDLTITAFEEGDETKFPKMSDRISFHVRPKAVNSEDTFEFTNGVDITKRTFWANKDTMDRLIGDFQVNE